MIRDTLSSMYTLVLVYADKHLNKTKKTIIFTIEKYDQKKKKRKE